MKEIKLTTLSDRLNYAMREKGMSQGMLARSTGMSQPTIWRISSGKAQGSSRIVDIANALGVSAEWLINGNGPMRISSNTERQNDQIPPENEWTEISVWDRDTPLSKDEVEVPFLRDIEFACGDGSVGDEDYNGFKLRFSKATLRRVGANTDGSGILCFPATGNSMEPVIPDGTTVAVNTQDKKIIDGKIYAISENGWKRIKMLHRTGPDSVSVRSFNSDEYPQEDKRLSDMEIIGRVFWYSVII